MKWPLIGIAGLVIIFLGMAAGLPMGVPGIIAGMVCGLLIVSSR